MSANANTKRETIVPQMDGNTICQKVRISDAPSIFAASIVDCEMADIAFKYNKILPEKLKVTYKIMSGVPARTSSFKMVSHLNIPPITHSIKSR